MNMKNVALCFVTITTLVVSLFVIIAITLLGELQLKYTTWVKLHYFKHHFQIK